ncbi:helix-turn-helix domain-containing protein [Streptomyces sp. NK08204]|uniref:helix-turn-helix domain-containing protein n=1 Tax=Streptomyces sp. NK08204 TaxID=2873260 RepID=UPI001CEC6008|nr:AraC family transcriptional regulator [Streptomyces sp. NK08204]
MEYLVQRSVMTIRERFHEPLSLDDLARSAMMSKFYFLRLFSRVTGVTPGRFLSAVRLYEAQRLLLTTTLNVAEISVRVGYASTGTFSRRFSESVGVSPTQYRQLDCAEAETMHGSQAHAGADRPPETTTAAATASLTGTVRTQQRPLSAVYLGLFSSPIMQGRPVAAAFATDEFRMCDVPPGTWYLHAVAHSAAAWPGEAHTEPPLLVDMAGPLRITAGAQVTVDLSLRPFDWTRPPILSAVPGVKGALLPVFHPAGRRAPAVPSSA